MIYYMLLPEGECGRSLRESGVRTPYLRFERKRDVIVSPHWGIRRLYPLPGLLATCAPPFPSRARPLDRVDGKGAGKRTPDFSGRSLTRDGVEVGRVTGVTSCGPLVT